MIALALVLDAATPAVAAAAPVEPLTLTVAPGVAWGYVTGDNLAPGATATLQLDAGYRYDEHSSVMAHLALGHLSGSANDFTGARYTYDYVPIFLAAAARAETLQGWLWGEVALGLHVDSFATNGMRNSSAALGVAVDVGGDVYHRGLDKVGVYLGVESEVGGQSYEGLTLGLAYRR